MNFAQHKAAIVPLLLVSALQFTPVSAGSDANRVMKTADDRDALLEARREKLRNKWEQRFRAADTDDNRLLSPAEADAARLPKRLIRNFSKIDLNDDGQLSPEELLSANEKRLNAQSRLARPKKFR